MKPKLIFLLSLFLSNQQYYINGMINIIDHPGVDHDVEDVNVENEDFNPFNDTWQHGNETINAWQVDDKKNPDENLSNVLKAKGLWSKNTNTKKTRICENIIAISV